MFKSYDSFFFKVRRATYGHPLRSAQTLDVTTEVRAVGSPYLRARARVCVRMAGARDHSVVAAASMRGSDVFEVTERRGAGRGGAASERFFITCNSRLLSWVFVCASER